MKEKAPERAPRPHISLQSARLSVTARAIVDVATAVTVTVVALAGLLGDGADQGTRNATNCSANGRAANVAGRQTADHAARCRADAGSLFRCSAAGERGADDQKREGFLHYFSPCFRSLPALRQARGVCA